MLNKIKNAIYTALVYICFRVKVYDKPEKLEQGIYICNHMAHYDGFLMRVVLKKANIYSIITNEWYDKKIARHFMFYEKCIPVDRNNPGTAWIKEVRKAIKMGASINIFPEGHTSKGEMDVFNPGFLLLSFMTGLPIVPVAHTGKYSFFFGPRKRVLIGKPVFLKKEQFSSNEESQMKMAAEFREIIEKMIKELESR